MSPGAPTSDIAHRVAEHVKVEPPWDVVGQRATTFELHLQGTEVETVRGPITVEGYGLRLFRPRGQVLGTGFQASTDLSLEGIRTVVKDAELAARHAEFPARSVELPSGARGRPEVEVVDRALWADPPRAIRAYLDALLAPFEGRKGAAPTFGSVKATLSELTIANSSGLRVGFPSTFVQLELGVKAFGGPEGSPPGEYWVTQTGRRLEPERAARSVDDWCRYAADARHAAAPPSGDLAVVLPPEVLAGIVPSVIGFRCSGAARLRQLAPEVGAAVAGDAITLSDDGTYPFGPGSAPYDDEGTPRSKRALVERGKVAHLLYDSLYASAFSTKSTGNGNRIAFGPPGPIRFALRPVPGESTLVVAPGDGGSTDELVEAAGDGLLVTQLGWASPDSISGGFGGEVRIGYRIRHGKLAEPVRGGTVGGVVLGPPGRPSLLASAAAVGSKAELADRLVSPPVLVRTLQVAGSSG